jgi:hypothetical protein
VRHQDDSTGARRLGSTGRWWFVGVAALYTAVAVAGFVPKALGGAAVFMALPLAVHIHAAVMGLLLLSFVAQAALARRDLALHRRLGWFSVFLGAAAFVSMLAVVDASMRREDPVQMPWLPQVWTLGIVQSATFAALFAGAILARRTPAWHRRLMAFAMLVTLQGALDRMGWLPLLPLPSFWASGARLFVLALPLVLFDLLTLRRLHPATLIGLGAWTLAAALLAAAWGDPSYAAQVVDIWRGAYGR